MFMIQLKREKLIFWMLFCLSLFPVQIVHRDLKPENFVFENPREDSNMKLIDFGCAKVAGDDEVISDVAGSPYYVAPEILSETAVRTGRVWKAADMWSVGQSTQERVDRGGQVYHDWRDLSYECCVNELIASHVFSFLLLLL